MSINSANNSCSFSKEHSDPSMHTHHSGEYLGQAISIVPPEEVRSLLEELPDELLGNIANRLSLRNLSVFARTCKTIHRLVNNHDLFCQKWFSRFTPDQQAQFREIAKGINEHNIHTLMGCFSKEYEVDQLLSKKDATYFPALLFYTLGRLMAGCGAFKAVEDASIIHDGRVRAFDISTNGCHLVTTIKATSRDIVSNIYSRGADGNWAHKTTLADVSRFFEASFSTDSRHLVTASNDNTAKIYWLDTDGNWVQKAILNNSDRVSFARFSSDGSHVLTLCRGHTVNIYGPDADGSWIQKAIITHSEFVCSARFSSDGRHVMTVGNDNTVKIYGPGADESWIEKAILNNSIPVFSVSFSSDGSHVLTQCIDKTVKIHGPSAEGSWIEKAIFTICGHLYSANFSSDGSHVLTMCMDENHTVKIYGPGTDGRWIEKAIITHSMFVYFASFSSDGHHVLTINRVHTVKIYGQDADGTWTHKATITNGNTPISFHPWLCSFSPDSCHVLTGSNNKAKIYGRDADGNWTHKATITHGMEINLARFSADGRHVVTISDGHTATIWRLCSKTIIKDREPCLIV